MTNEISVPSVGFLNCINIETKGKSNFINLSISSLPVLSSLHFLRTFLFPLCFQIIFLLIILHVLPFPSVIFCFYIFSSFSFFIFIPFHPLTSSITHLSSRLYSKGFERTRLCSFETIYCFTFVRFKHLRETP